jgi:hypothetical protein
LGAGGDKSFRIVVFLQKVVFALPITNSSLGVGSMPISGVSEIPQPIAAPLEHGRSNP